MPHPSGANGVGMKWKENGEMERSEEGVLYMIYLNTSVYNSSRSLDDLFIGCALI